MEWSQDSCRRTGRKLRGVAVESPHHRWHMHDRHLINAPSLRQSLAPPCTALVWPPIARPGIARERNDALCCAFVLTGLALIAFCPLCVNLHTHCTSKSSASFRTAHHPPQRYCRLREEQSRSPSHCRFLLASFAEASSYTNELLAGATEASRCLVRRV